MRKLILLICCLLGLIASAQTQWYQATSYAVKEINSYGRWTDWTDWYQCNVKVKFDLTNDIITIYSRSTQVYAVYNYRGRSTDSGGGTQVHYDVIDQDYDRGSVRLRVEPSGQSQIYVDFANVMWVYNVYRIR